MTRPSIVVIAALSSLSVSAAQPPGPPAASGPLLPSSALTWEEIQAGAGKGNSRPVFRSRTATLDELEMHVTHLPVGKQSHPPHQHLEEEVMIVKEGTLEAMVGDKIRRVGPGAVVFQASNVPHNVRNVGDVTAVYHVMRWISPGATAAVFQSREAAKAKAAAAAGTAAAAAAAKPGAKDPGAPTAPAKP